MNIEEYSLRVEEILRDEELLRLLYYKPKNKLDNPLDSAKPNILDKPVDELWEIIDYHLVPAIRLDDLQKESVCRIFYYAGYGRSAKKNYLFSNQEYIFDVIVHNDIQITDKRLEKICDRLNDLLFNKRIGGVGKTLFKVRQPINGVPSNYMGFKLVYEFVNESY